MNTEEKMTNERQVLELIATDRLHIPVSSMSGKLKRRQPKLAQELGLVEGRPFFGDRAYARVESEDVSKARRLSDAVETYCADRPREGAVLKGYIAETRIEAETHVYFGMNEGCRLTEADYLGVMADLGFSEAVARNLYQPLLDVSRKISKKRDEGERSVLIG